MDIKDMDHFTLQPGETLILRARKPMSREHLERMQSTLTATKLPFVLIAEPDFDIMAGVLTNVGEEDDNSEVAAMLHKEAVIAAYHDGRIVRTRYKGNRRWHDIHRLSYPHEFDFDAYEYELS